MTKLFFLSDNIGCYLIIIAFVLSYMLFFHLKRYAFKRLILIRVNYAIVFSCITILLAYVVSLNSSVLSAYDKSPPLNFNFLNPYDAIRFPFEQLKIQQGQPEPTVLNINSNDISITSHSFIIVDKTKSTTLPHSMVKAVEGLKINLKQYILSSNQSPRPELEPQGQLDTAAINKLDLRDIVVLYFIRSLYNNSTDNNILSYQILLYYGDNIFYPAGSSTERPNTSSVMISNAFKNYFEAVNMAKANKKQTTNFDDILSKLSENRYTKNNKSNYTNVIILSDFIHEPKKSGVSFGELEKSINNKANNEFKLSLYLLSNKEILNDSTKKTLEIIKDNYLNSNTYFYDEATVLETTNDYEIYLNSLFSTTINESKVNINCFYPEDNFNKINCAKAICTINNCDYGYVFNFNNQNLPLLNNSSFLRLNNVEIIHCNENKIITCKNQGENLINLEIILKNNLPQDNYLDISEPNNLYTHSFKINILEKIPRTSIIVMCICYIIILLALLTNSITYIRCAVKSLRNGGNFFHFENIEECKRNLANNINNITELELYSMILLQLFIIIWILIIVILVGLIFFKFYPILALLILLAYFIYIIINTTWENRKLHFISDSSSNKG